MPLPPPQPRSRQQLLGEQLAIFTARTGIARLKAANPLLSVFDVVAGATFRSSRDVFAVLAAQPLEGRTGSALDLAGRDEDVERVGETPASGQVRVGDSSFTKVETTVYAGAAAPLAGSTVLKVQDASDFPATGQLYVGRGTGAEEGPISYTAVLPPGVGGGFSGGAWWAIQLATGTLRHHNLDDQVLLAQGGDRTVQVGAIVQTQDGRVRYRVTQPATLRDGEVVLDGVRVRALLPGRSGNVPAGSITAWAAAPWAGATVTNPSPLTNGTPLQSDDQYREAIRDARRSRARATPLALQRASVGVESREESRRSLSSSVRKELDALVSVTVDDGSGYEEQTAGVAIEQLLDGAVGGELEVALARRPVARARLTSSTTPPFQLRNGDALAVRVGGIVTQHVLSGLTDGAATPVQVAASINSDPDLGWRALTLDGRSRVAILAKTERQDDLELEVPVGGQDGAAALGLESRAQTLLLYRDDVLLHKDGVVAEIRSNPVGLWSALSGNQTLTVKVDGIQIALDGVQFPAITGQDFIDAGTSYSTVGVNDAPAWAAVLQLRIPGVTVEVEQGRIVVRSNRGPADRASLEIVSGTLVSAGMFAVQVRQGRDPDYSLDRGTGEIRLQAPMQAGSRLRVGTQDGRGFVESPSLAPPVQVGSSATSAVGGLVRAGSTVTVTTAADHGFQVGQVVVLDPGEADFPAGPKKVLTTPTSTTFTYGEAGAAVASSLLQSWGLAGRIWTIEDAVAEQVPHGVTASTPVDLSSTATGWGQRVRVESTAAANLFGSVQPGDLVVFWDPALGTLTGWRRVTVVDGAGTYFEFSSSVAHTGAALLLTQVGVRFVRTAGTARRHLVPAGTSYTASTLADALDPQLEPLGRAVTSRTNHLRVRTSTVDQAGSIAIAARDQVAAPVGLEPGDSVANQPPQVASLLAGEPAGHWPSYVLTDLAAASPPDLPSLDQAQPPTPDLLLAGLRARDDGTTAALARWGNLAGHRTEIESLSGAGPYAVSIRTIPEDGWIDQDRVQLARPYRFGDQDQLVVRVGDRTFTPQLYRRLEPVGTTYGTTVVFRDADDGGQSLFDTFGPQYRWEDHELQMRARIQTHLQGDSTHYATPPADQTRAILWRWHRHGPDGNRISISYQPPDDADQALAVEWFLTQVPVIPVQVKLAGGAERSIQTRYTTRVGLASIEVDSGGNSSDVAFLFGFEISSASRTTNVTTLTLTLPAGVTDHGLQVGEVVWVESNNGAFGSGAYTVTGTPSATTITYAETAADQGATPNIGSVSADHLGEVELTGVTNGDWFRLRDHATVTSTDYRSLTIRVTDSGPRFVRGKIQADIAVDTVPSWEPIGAPDAVVLFQNPAQTAADVVAAVNALDTVVTATLIGDGSGTIDRPSYEEAYDAVAGANPLFVLLDGVQYVRSWADSGGDLEVTFKSTASTVLVNNSDWENEEVRIVPCTARNVADWLGNLATSGLSSVAEVGLGLAGQRPEISALAAGSNGSVQVLGGAGQAWSATLVGGADLAAGGLAIRIARDLLGGFRSGQLLELENQTALPRPGTFDALTQLDSISADGTVTLDGGGTPVSTTRTNNPGAIIQLDLQGGLVLLTDTALGTLSLAGVQPGDHVQVRTPASPTAGVPQVDAANVGIFRVVAVTTSSPDGTAGGVWIRNPNAVEQSTCEADVRFLAPNSILPGDRLVINTDLWGAENAGSWTVRAPDTGDPFADPHVFYLDVSDRPLTPQGAGAAFGANSPLIQALEGGPATTYRELQVAIPDPDDQSLAILILSGTHDQHLLGESAGTVARALCRPAWPTGQVRGLDAYRYQTGLLGEVSRVLHGDPADVATYPGYAAAGVSLYTQPATLRPFQLTILVRLRTGTNPQEVVPQIQSAAAAAVNRSARVGVSPDLSLVVAEVRRVPGVSSVVAVSPALVVGQDLLVVQAHERAQIVDPSTDVTVQVAGE